MTTGITELVLVIGKSRLGSYAEACADGLNTLLSPKDMNILEGKVNLTTILFDDSCHIIHDRVNIHTAEHLTKNDLLSSKESSAWTTAISTAINKTESVLRHTNDELCPDKVLYVIITDRATNADEEQYAALKEKIAKSKNNGCGFLMCSYNVDTFTKCCEAWEIGLDYENVSGTFNSDNERNFFIGLLGDISRFISSDTDEYICMYTTDWWQKLYTTRSNVFAENVISIETGSSAYDKDDIPFDKIKDAFSKLHNIILSLTDEIRRKCYSVTFNDCMRLKREILAISAFCDSIIEESETLYYYSLPDTGKNYARYYESNMKNVYQQLAKRIYNLSNNIIVRDSSELPFHTVFQNCLDSIADIYGYRHITLPKKVSDPVIQQTYDDVSEYSGSARFEKMSELLFR